VLGETVPVWLPSALALIGLIGSIVTARLLFTDWLDGFELFSERAEIGASATQVAPPETVAVGEEIPETPGRPDETEGSLGRENDRLPAATETGLVAEQTSATLSTAKSPPPVSAAREPAPDDSSAMKGSTVRAVSVKQAEGGRASIQQIGERPKREADMRTMAAAAKDETPSGIGSASDTAVQAGTHGCNEVNQYRFGVTSHTRGFRSHDRRHRSGHVWRCRAGTGWLPVDQIKAR